MLMLFLSLLGFQIHSGDYLLKAHLMQHLYRSYTAEKLKGKTKGKKFADETLNFINFGTFNIVLIVEIFTPYVVYLIAPGFIEDNTKFNLAVDLTRITFPFLALVSLSSFFAGILNSENKFAAAAAAPIFLNLILNIFFSYSHII